MPSTVSGLGARAEVRHPRAHEIEHRAVDAELFVQRADRGDGTVVDVGDEARRRVEQRVVVFVLTSEELAEAPDSGDARSLRLLDELEHFAVGAREAHEAQFGEAGTHRHRHRRRHRRDPAAPRAPRTTASRSATSMANRHIPTRVRGARAATRLDRRRAEADEDEMHLATTRRREHHFVEVAGPSMRRCEASSRRGREARHFGEAEAIGRTRATRRAPRIRPRRTRPEARQPSMSSTATPSGSLPITSRTDRPPPRSCVLHVAPDRAAGARRALRPPRRGRRPRYRVAGSRW